MNTELSNPHIVLSDADYDRLAELAAAVLPRIPAVAGDLLTELDRAEIVGETPAGVVGMGSTVTYKADDGTERMVVLVYPQDADIATGRVSILTPIGTALVGLSEGQTMVWTARDGRRHELTVLAVAAPSN